MKVAIRCRPAFQDEVGSFRGTYFPIVSTKKGEGGAGSSADKYGVVELHQVSGRTRDFYYDNVFGEGSTQVEVAIHPTSSPPLAPRMSNLPSLLGV